MIDNELHEPSEGGHYEERGHHLTGGEDIVALVRFYAESAATAAKGWELTISAMEQLQKQVVPSERLLVMRATENAKRRYIEFAREVQRAEQAMDARHSEGDQAPEGLGGK